MRTAAAPSVFESSASLVVTRAQRGQCGYLRNRHSCGPTGKPCRRPSDFGYLATSSPANSRPRVVPRYPKWNLLAGHLLLRLTLRPAGLDAHRLAVHLRIVGWVRRFAQTVITLVSLGPLQQ